MSTICNECGRPVALGSGRFLSRILDLLLVEERPAFGRPYPEGDFLCMDCALAPSHQIVAPMCSGKAAAVGPVLGLR